MTFSEARVMWFDCKSVHPKVSRSRSAETGSQSYFTILADGLPAPSSHTTTDTPIFTDLANGERKESARYRQLRHSRRGGSLYTGQTQGANCAMEIISRV